MYKRPGNHDFCTRELEHEKQKVAYLEKELKALKEAYWELEEARNAIYTLSVALSPFLKEEILNVCQEQQCCKEG